MRKIGVLLVAYVLIFYLNLNSVLAAVGNKNEFYFCFNIKNTSFFLSLFLPPSTVRWRHRYASPRRRRRLLHRSHSPDGAASRWRAPSRSTS